MSRLKPARFFAPFTISVWPKSPLFFDFWLTWKSRKKREQIFKKRQRANRIQILWIVKKTKRRPIIASAIASRLLIKSCIKLEVFSLRWRFSSNLANVPKSFIYWGPHWCLCLKRLFFSLLSTYSFFSYTFLKRKHWFFSWLLAGFLE